MEFLLVVTVLVLVCEGFGYSDSRSDGVTITAVTKPAAHGEGPHWDPSNQQLYFVDIQEGRLHRYDPATGTDHQLKLPAMISLVIPVRHSPNEFIITQNHTLSLLTWDGSSSDYTLDDIVTVEKDKPGNRFNDGKADVVGRVWAGTMGPEPVVGQVTPDQATLYKVDVDSNYAQPMISPVSVSNGIAWNGDVMYYVDTPSNVIAAYDYDAAKGTICNKKIVFNITKAGIEGFMDGMTIDSDGNLWVALFNGWHVLQVDPRRGKALRRIQLDVQRPTSVMWCGSDLCDLCVTSSRAGLSEEEVSLQPLAGSLFRVSGLGVTGTTAFTAVRTTQ